jgi:hypothetical protein
LHKITLLLPLSAGLGRGESVLRQVDALVRCRAVPMPSAWRGKVAEPSMGTSGSLWVARLTPRAGRSLDDLLKAPLSLDVWQREQGALIAVASDHTLRELERRRLAHVERISTRDEYHRRAQAASEPTPGSAKK